MLRVEILPAQNSKWCDHLRNEIDRLVFTKEYQSNYTPGHYPLESLGSLYRNIDNFRESPFQSRTDWEITFPSIYSSTDGSFRTVDLLYWLESVNEEDGRQFDLIGCEATLFDGSKAIYRGRVESISSGGQTSSLRISDWLGTPKIGQSLFPVSVGAADEVSRWPVVLTREQGILHLAISSRPLKSKPTFWLKISQQKYLKINKFHTPTDEGSLMIKYLGNGYQNADITWEEKGEAVYELKEDLGIENLIINDANADNKLRPPPYFRDKPDYYTLGEDDDMEIVEAWSNRVWAGDGIGYEFKGYPVGRPLSPKRHAHKKGTPLRKMPDAFELMGYVRAIATPESMVLDTNGDDPVPPFQKGNPQYLYWQSQKEHETGHKISFSKNAYPQIRAFDMLGSFLRGPEFTVTINLSCPDAPVGAQVASNGINALYYALCYKGYSDNVTYKASLKIGDVRMSLPAEMDGTVAGKVLQLKENMDLSTALKVEFTFKVVSNMGQNTPDAYAKAVEDIHILYVQARYALVSKIDENNLYASGTFENSSEPEEGSDEGTSSIKSSIASLLQMAGASCPVEGDTNALSYGAVINREAFALRDKLRSLAAESATLVRFSPDKKEIIATDISLRKNPDAIFIPMDAFLHEGIYSFKMESPDRGDLLSGITINWGKDFETKKYEHIFSITLENGITFDGEKPDELYINEDMWAKAFERIRANAGIGAIKVVDSEWIADWKAAENMAYNLLRWNSAPMRKAQARCIFTELKAISIKEKTPIVVRPRKNVI